VNLGVAVNLFVTAQLLEEWRFDICHEEGLALGRRQQSRTGVILLARERRRTVCAIHVYLSLSFSSVARL
jgi:hypothetical protein